MNTRSVVTGAVVLACGLAAAGAMGLGHRARETSANEAAPRIYEWWVAPGTYTGFVFTSSANANTRRWIVTIEHAGTSFPVSINPGETVTIPFAAGWTIRPEHEVRVRSIHVPFDDLKEFDPLRADGPMFVNAWGLTPNGPAAFVPPKK